MPKPSPITKLVASTTKQLMKQLHNRQESAAVRIASIVDEYWKRLAEAIASSVPPDQIVIASRLAHSQMTKDLRKAFVEEMAGLQNYTHQRAVAMFLDALPADWGKMLLEKAVVVGSEPKSPTAGQTYQKKSTLQTKIFSTREVVPVEVLDSVISDTTRLGNPSNIASTINTMRLQGKTTRQIAKAIEPQVYGVKSTVARVVRDAGQYAATVQNVSTWNSLPRDFIVGYEVHAVPKTMYSRPDHLERSGTVYYFEPTRNQKSMADCPLPPYDREGGRLVLKYNCRCYVSPVFAENYSLRMAS
jgi:hypothetical protein